MPERICASLQVLYCATCHLRPHFGIIKRAHPNKILTVFRSLPYKVMVCQFSENLTKTSVGDAIRGAVTNRSFVCVILCIWGCLAFDDLYVFWVLVYGNLIMGWTTEKLGFDSRLGQTFWKCVIPVVCVWELERVCSITHLCQLRCLMTILDNYMFHWA